MDENKNQIKKALNEIVAIVYITQENAVFERKSDFLTLTLTAPNEEGVVETKTYERIFLHRAFPFDNPFSYISVLDKDNKEIGMISDLSVLKEEDAEAIKSELNRKYYTPVVKSIISLFTCPILPMPKEASIVKIQKRNASTLPMVLQPFFAPRPLRR